MLGLRLESSCARRTPTLEHDMTSLCASARQITPTSAFSDVGMARSPSRPPRRAAVAAWRSISTNYEEPYYPYYLFEADSSGEEIIDPKTNGEVTDLTSESDDDADKGEVSKACLRYLKARRWDPSRRPVHGRRV